MLFASLAGGKALAEAKSSSVDDGDAEGIEAIETEGGRATARAGITEESDKTERLG